MLSIQHERQAPPAGDPILVALETYSYWLAKGAPVGTKLPGQGFLKLPPPAQKADYARGAAVTRSTARCATVRTARGSRAAARRSSRAVGRAFVQLGRGMGDIRNAAGFIKANMPLAGGTLTDQEAWDVATFMDSHERPQDPRFTAGAGHAREVPRLARFEVRPA